MLDTHSMFKRLASTGMPEPQAEVVVDLIRERQEQYVSRDVLRFELAAAEERLSRRIDALETRQKQMEIRLDGLEQRMDRLEQRMDRLEQRMDRLEQRMDALEERVGRLELRIETLGRDLTIRLGAMMAASIGLVGALVAIF